MGSHVKGLTKIINLGAGLAAAGVVVDTEDLVPLGIVLQRTATASTVTFNNEDFGNDNPISGVSIATTATRTYYPLDSTKFFGIRKIRVKPSATLHATGETLLILGEV